MSATTTTRVSNEQPSVRGRELWRAIAARKDADGSRRPHIVSDGAVTIGYPLLKRRWTYPLEVVRAGVSGLAE